MSRIIESPYGSPFSKWFKVALVIVGSAFFIVAFLKFSHGNSSSVFSYLLIGALCFLFMTHKKRLYLCEEGIVREQSLMSRKHAELFPWNKVKAVSFMFQGDQVIVFFEKGFQGWRLVFSRNDEARLREYITSRRSDLTIETISR